MTYETHGVNVDRLRLRKHHITGRWQLDERQHGRWSKVIRLKTYDQCASYAYDLWAMYEGRRNRCEREAESMLRMIVCTDQGCMAYATTD